MLDAVKYFWQLKKYRLLFFLIQSNNYFFLD